MLRAGVNGQVFERDAGATIGDQPEIATCVLRALCRPLPLTIVVEIISTALDNNVHGECLCHLSLHLQAYRCVHRSAPLVIQITFPCPTRIEQERVRARWTARLVAEKDAEVALCACARAHLDLQNIVIRHALAVWERVQKDTRRLSCAPVRQLCPAGGACDTDA